MLVVTLLVLAALPALAAKGKKVTLSGVLVDVSCATERAGDLDGLRIKHTKKCLQMPDCDKSGFALLTADNKVIRFDEAGNQQARTLIAKTEKERDWQVKVSGRLDGEALAVKKLTLAP
ncbi:MAG TPA: hypothetical protein VL382_10895 [Terriglobales bacterium]|nr:hypothetical protein [Terriglobales bacterium]